MKNSKSIIITIMLLLALAIFSDVATATPPDKNGQLTPSEFTDGGHLYLIWEHDTIYCTELSDILHESGSTVYKYDKTTGLVEFTYNPELPDMFNDFFYINNGDLIGGSVGTANMPFSNTMIPLNPKLGIFVYDNDEDTMTVIFSTNTSGSWEVIETFENVVSNTFVECSSITGVNEYNTLYWIRVYVSDDTDNFEDTNWFITMQMPYIEPSNTYVDDNQISSWYDNAHVKTIQEGIDNVSSGGVVYIYNGNYIELEKIVNGYGVNILVNKTVTIKGESRDNVIINGSCNSEFTLYRILYVNADNVKIDNMTINGIDTNYTSVYFDSNFYAEISNCSINSGYNGISVYSITGSSITNCNIDNCSNIGITLYGDSCEVSYSNVTNCKYGIRLTQADYMSVNNCNLLNNRYGFYLSQSADALQADNCTLTGWNTTAGYGVFLYFDGGSSWDCVFEDMSISNFNTGFYIYGYSENTTVNNLTVYNCGNGVINSYGSDNHFSNLTIYNCDGDGFGIYKSVHNNTLRDSTIDNTGWGFNEGWGSSAPEYTTIENIIVTNSSSYGIFLDSAFHDNSIYKRIISKNNPVGLYLHDSNEGFIGDITWDETNLVYNNDLDYFVDNNTSINIFSNYLFDSNIENEVTDSEPYVNYHHVDNSGLKEFNTAKMMANCSSGESAKITILDNNLTMWSVNQTSGSIYQKLGGFEVNSEYQVKFDGIFLHYYTATTDTMLESSTGVIYANYSDDWSSHIFTIEMDELIFPPIISTCLYKYVGFAVFIIICIALIMWGFTSKKRIRVRKIKYR